MDCVTIAGTATVVEAKHSVTDGDKYRVGLILEAETLPHKRTRMRGTMFSEHEVSVAVGDRVNFTAALNQMETKHGPVIGLRSLALIAPVSSHIEAEPDEPLIEALIEDRGFELCSWQREKAPEPGIEHPGASKYPEGSAMRAALNRAAAKAAQAGDEPPF